MKDIDNQKWTELTAQDVNSLIIDVRTDEEVNEGLIHHATHCDIFNPQQFMSASITTHTKTH